MKKQKNEDVLPIPIPTEQQFLALNHAYQYFNRELFGGQLPGCILTFSRKRNAHGFMAPARWRRVDEQRHSTHEIALTHITLHREPKLVFSTLVHEQVHVWQVEFGNPSRSGYHNQEWADKMEQIGLMPSDTGQPGGKKTGQHMSHFIITDGDYERAFDQMPPEFLLPFTSLEGGVVNSMLTGSPLPAGVELNRESSVALPSRKTKPSTTALAANPMFGETQHEHPLRPLQRAICGHLIVSVLNSVFFQYNMHKISTNNYFFSNLCTYFIAYYLLFSTIQKIY